MLYDILLKKLVNIDNSFIIINDIIYINITDKNDIKDINIYLNN